ncbi:MAG TPA: hypothetical protein VN915_05685 [Elusimicrobiota bacterium]|nr:hypothetical protein [Elusimicrobiota bacterium]
MNIMIAAVGVDPGFAAGGGSAQEAIIGFAIVGLILLFAAGRLCRQGHAHRRAHHVSHYVSRF